MSDATTRFLIVEDEMIIGANISMQLGRLGYDVIGIIPRGEEAILFLKENHPDIILMDINLKGNLDGVDTAKQIQKMYDIPIIYITANADDVNFNRAKTTQPEAFISKPFKKIDLQRAIELTLSRKERGKDPNEEDDSNGDTPYILSDSIFVKHHDSMVKIAISDILYVEAERNYCCIYTSEKNYLLVMTLKNLDEKLPREHFIRIHRSFIINISKISEVGTAHVSTGNKVIPLSKSYRNDLLRRLRMI